MPNLSQAPKIKYNGIKDRRNDVLTGYTNRSLLLEEKIAQGIDGKHFVAYKVMMFLTGNAEGFRVVLETITKRLNITKSAYYDARNYLSKMGWITCTGDCIVVNYDVIYGIKTTAETTSSLTTAEALPKAKATAEYTPIIKEVTVKTTAEKQPMKTTAETTSILKTTAETTSKITDETISKTTAETTHNNIIDNTITNTITAATDNDECESLEDFIKSWGF